MSTVKKPDSGLDETVTALGVTIPVRNELTVGEFIKLEELVKDSPNDTMYDVRTIAIFAESRLGKKLDPEAFYATAFDADAVNEAAEALRDPFYAGLLARQRRASLREARRQEPDQLKQSIAFTKDLLSTLEATLAVKEPTGGSSKA